MRRNVAKMSNRINAVIMWTEMKQHLIAIVESPLRTNSV